MSMLVIKQSLQSLKCGCANWVVGRLPVTQSGRNDAQGLRSVNAIFHHHDQRSHRPKVVCSRKKRCCPHPSSVCVRASSAHEAAVEWNNSSQAEQIMHVRLNLVKHGWVLHMKLSLSLAAYWQSQSPQAAPQPFRLNILTWFLLDSSCLVFV